MTGTDHPKNTDSVNKRKYIFIASSSYDLSAQQVAKKLVKRGYIPIIYAVDSVFDGSRTFSSHLDENGILTFNYAGLNFRSDEITAAWYRHCSDLASHQERDPLRRFQLESNIRSLQDGIFSAFGDKWLNDPYTMRRADGKVHQLMIASSLGMNIPETVIGNDYNEIVSLKSEKIIVKVPFNRLENRNGVKKLFFTTILDNKKSAMPLRATPFPGIWQPFISKRKEWRITIVDDKVFCAAIHTTEDAKDDWRRHQFAEGKVNFKAENFPNDLQEKSKKLLKKLGLRYGALDFIETNKGIVFLEVNPNGQYGWIEDTLGFPISDAIANSLIDIAQTKPTPIHK